MGRLQPAEEVVSTTLLLRFPLGRVHANPWGRHVNEGEAEWPPSPWRLLRGLVSTWHERAPDLDGAVVEAMLAQLCDPPSYLLPDANPSTTRHWYPDGVRDAKSSWAEGTDKALDSFVVLAPGQDLVVRWPADLQHAEHEALTRLAELLPYVGRADSVCEARLLDEPPAGRWLRPLDESGAPQGGIVDDVIDLLVPRRPLDMQGLQVRTRELRRAGQLDPPAAQRVTYPRPTPPPTAPPRSQPVAGVECLTFSLDATALPSMRLAPLVADTLRAASQSRYGDQPPPGSISGHEEGGAAARGHRHAHWWVLPGRGTRAGLTARGVCYVPALIRQDDLSMLRRSRWLRDPQARFRPIRVVAGPAGSLTRLLPELAPEIKQPTWHTLLPYAPPRYQDRRLPWSAQVDAALREEAELRGLPAIREVRVLQGPWMEYARWRASQHRRDGRRAAGVEVTFSETIGGPLSLGALSHFGLGLFLPGRSTAATASGG